MLLLGENMDYPTDDFRYYGIVSQPCEIIKDERDHLAILFHPVSFEEYMRRNDEYKRKIESQHGPVEYDPSLATSEGRKQTWKRMSSYTWVAQIIRQNANSFIINVIDSKDEEIRAMYPLTEKADINWIAWEYEHWFDAAFKRAEEIGKPGLKLRGLNAAYHAIPHFSDLQHKMMARRRMMGAG